MGEKVNVRRCDVPADFVAAFPEDVRSNYPVVMRYLTRVAPGQLREMAVGRFSPLDLGLEAGKRRDKAMDEAQQAISKEISLVLKCVFVSADPRYVERDVYWFDRKPDFVAERKATTVVQQQLEKIGTPRKVCPASRSSVN